MQVEQLEFESDNLRMYHTEGHKDGFKVEVEVKDGVFSPTNEEIFALLHMWYTAEEAGYSDGYGKMMPWFYNTLCYFDRDGYNVASNANSKRGKDSLEYFEEAIANYSDEIIEEIVRLRKKAGIEDDVETVFDY